MTSKESDSILEIARQGYFFVGGQYADVADVADSNSPARVGQMYVEYQIPRYQACELPIVMFSGLGQSGLNYTGTPDGREGWAQFFLRRGYAVYILDQPSRARSPHHPGSAALEALSVKRVEDRFTAPANAALWPQSVLHTQWPGAGVAGDPVFDQYMDQVYASLPDLMLSQQLNRDAGAQLLDRIGPAILMTHSQSGLFGWLVADARPTLVKAIVALEPSGPPVYEQVLADARVEPAIESGTPAETTAETTAGTTASAGPGTATAGARHDHDSSETRSQPHWYHDGALTKPYGLTGLPLTYLPPLREGEKLQFVKDTIAGDPSLVAGWKQAEPARQLANLRHIPVLVVTGEASYHIGYDHCTVDYLRQAGVATTFIPLAERGIRGNGHMLMIELNNAEIAGVVNEWLEQTLAATRTTQSPT